MIVIVDYAMGNIGSIANMYRRLGIKATIAQSPNAIAEADRLILPGVGAFDQGMGNLERLGLRTAIDRRVQDEGIPVLGICLGMQLMTRSSEEGRRAGLGWIPADTVHFRKGAEVEARAMRFPHIGWEFVDIVKAHPMVDSLLTDPRFYFVHTYRVVCDHQTDVLLKSAYGDIEFTAAFARANVAGVQFHPEKSHKFGMQLLASFARWQPRLEPAGKEGCVRA